MNTGYTTNASGQKIRQQLIEDGRVGTQRDYAGPFVYINNQLAWVNTSYVFFAFLGELQGDIL